MLWVWQTWDSKSERHLKIQHSWCVMNVKSLTFIEQWVLFLFYQPLQTSKTEKDLCWHIALYCGEEKNRSVCSISAHCSHIFYTPLYSKCSTASKRGLAVNNTSVVLLWVIGYCCLPAQVYWNVLMGKYHTAFFWILYLGQHQRRSQ